MMAPAPSICLFCRIASGAVPSHTVFETPRLRAFLDIHPIRPGHTQIIPKEHHAVFDEMPADLLCEIATAAQRVARVLKAMYGVKRVGFAFTGTDIAHVHAHVVPMVATDDLTSRRYIVEEQVTYALPPSPSDADFADTARRIREGLADAG